MYRYISHITIISCLLFCISCDDNDTNDTPPDSDAGPPYNVGDFIIDDHQAMNFDFCYPSCTNNPDNCDDLTTDEADTTFSLSHHTGKVFMIEMSATW